MEYHPVLTSNLFPLLVGLLLMGLLPMNTKAQNCPFTEDDAVADTLDPAGYYPLDIGTLREYVSSSGAFLSGLGRQEVIADTLIDGDRFYKLQVISFDAEHTTIITEADTSFHYRGVVDGVLLRWTSQRGKVEIAQLAHDFNTCYDRSIQNTAVVEGSYDTTFVFQNADTFALAALKKFTFMVPQASESHEYGYGLGFLRSRGEPDTRTNLTYARINGQEYGTPLDSLYDIRVSTKPPSSLHESPRLAIYPNPARSFTHFELILTHPGRTSIHVFDMLGRLVAKPMQDVYLPMGRHSLRWNSGPVAAGVYVTQVLIEGHPLVKKRFVVVR